MYYLKKCSFPSSVANNTERMSKTTLEMRVKRAKEKEESCRWAFFHSIWSV